MLDANHTQPRKKPWYGRRWVMVLVLVLGLPIAVFLFITFVPLDDQGNGVHLKLHATKTNANNALSSSTSTRSHPYAQLACGRVAVVNQHDHRIMRSVAQQLADRLAALDMTETVDLIDLAAAGKIVSPGERLYDLYVRLDMPKFERSGLLPTGRTIDTLITAQVGGDLWDSHHGYHDNQTPPLARINSRLKLEHQSTTTGYESASARYTDAINGIAEQIGNDIEKKLREVSSKHGTLVQLPEGFYPAYAPLPDDLPLPDDPALVQLISGHGLMVANHTVWSLPTTQPTEVLRELLDRLKQADWNISDNNFDSEHVQTHHLRARRGEAVYEAFEARHLGLRDIRGEQRTVVIRYRRHMTREQCEPHIRALFTDQTQPIETLMMFHGNSGRELRKMLAEQLMQRDHLPVLAELAVVRYLHKQGHDEQALTRLQQAHVKQQLSDQSHTKEIKKLGREITGDKQWEPARCTVEQLDAAGYTAMSLNKPYVVEVDLNQTARFYLPEYQTGNEQSGLTLVGIIVERASIPEGTYRISMRRGTTAGSGSGSSSSTPHHPPSPWRGSVGHGYNNTTWLANAEEISPKRFRVTLHVKTPESRAEPPQRANQT